MKKFLEEHQKTGMPSLISFAWSCNYIIREGESKWQRKVCSQ